MYFRNCEIIVAIPPKLWLKTGDCGEICLFGAKFVYLQSETIILMGKKLPSYLLEKNRLVGTVTFSVLFALIFLNIYIPFSDTAWFGLGNSQTFLFTAGFAFIAILVLVLSRVLMYNAGKICEFTYAGYVLWCLAEVLAVCSFYTFVTIDIVRPDGSPWSVVFSRALLYCMIALVIPYIITGMYFTIMEKNKTIRLMNSRHVVSDDTASPKGEDKVTLFDNNGALRLSVRTSNLYFIESDDNYIKVWYADSNGEMETYMMRCRLKTVEQSFSSTSLARCHRKYIVNLDKVKILRKEKDGYWLVLDTDAIPPLAVSRTYTEAVLARFRKESPEKLTAFSSGRTQP